MPLPSVVLPIAGLILVGMGLVVVLVNHARKTENNKPTIALTVTGYAFLIWALLNEGILF